jgi:hypothetical protein
MLIEKENILKNYFDFKFENSENKKELNFFFFSYLGDLFIENNNSIEFFLELIFKCCNYLKKIKFYTNLLFILKKTLTIKEEKEKVEKNKEKKFILFIKYLNWIISIILKIKIYQQGKNNEEFSILSYFSKYLAKKIKNNENNDGFFLFFFISFNFNLFFFRNFFNN